MDDYFILELHSDQGHKLFTSYEGGHPIDGRPHLVTPGGECHWGLREEIHDWFVECDLAYELGGSRNSDYTYNYQICFDTKDQAALFKLMFV